MPRKGDVIDFARAAGGRKMEAAGVKLPRLDRKELLRQVQELDKVSIEIPKNTKHDAAIDDLENALKMKIKPEEIVVWGEDCGILEFKYKSRNGLLIWGNAKDSIYMPFTLICDSSGRAVEIRNAERFY